MRHGFMLVGEPFAGMYIRMCVCVCVCVYMCVTGTHTYGCMDVCITTVFTQSVCLW